MPREQDMARQVSSEIIEISHAMGFNVVQPKQIRLPETRGNVTGSYVQAIKQELQGRSSIQMVVCIIQSNSKETYDAIKKICCFI